MLVLIVLLLVTLLLMLLLCYSGYLAAVKCVNALQFFKDLGTRRRRRSMASSEGKVGKKECKENIAVGGKGWGR